MEMIFHLPKGLVNVVFMILEVVDVYIPRLSFAFTKVSFKAIKEVLLVCLQIAF
mgnify:FL=1